MSDIYRTIADGLRTTPVGKVPWKQIKRFVDDFVTVSEEGICEAVRVLHFEGGVKSEPSGAVSIAAYLFHRSSLPSGVTVAVVSGGNVSDELFPQILHRTPAEELVVR